MHHDTDVNGDGCGAGAGLSPEGEIEHHLFQISFSTNLAEVKCNFTGMGKGSIKKNDRPGDDGTLRSV